MCGLNIRVPALQAQNPEIKAQTHQKNKTKQKLEPEGVRRMREPEPVAHACNPSY
jgi:hypothetical protein